MLLFIKKEVIKNIHHNVSDFSSSSDYSDEYDEKYIKAN